MHPAGPTSIILATPESAFPAIPLTPRTAQTENVRPSIDPMRFATGLFRTHVRRCFSVLRPFPKFSSRSARPKSTTYGASDASSLQITLVKQERGADKCG